VTAVYAHRGYTDGFRENTLGAFAEARARGADGVELDVRRSADGALVVHHDAEIEGVGTICELGVRELPDYVPLLDAALAACEGLTVNVEIKNVPVDPGFEPDHAIAAAVVAAVRDAGWADRVIVSSFNPDTVDAVRAADGAMPVGWLLAPGADAHALLPLAAGRGYTALHPFVVGVDEALVEQAHEAGVAINTWTVNDPAGLRAMVALGVDVVITDNLVEALALALPA
jgi:glycerophosphoryl diester phosphodiesterase